MHGYGHMIRTAREDQGLTQEKLAELLNRSPVTVCRWEQEKAIPTGLSRQRLCKLLHIDLGPEPATPIVTRTTAYQEDSITVTIHVTFTPGTLGNPLPDIRINLHDGTPASSPDL